MGVRKWLMKQQWRIVQVRGIWSLFYGIMILAYAYFLYIPIFSDMGVWGPIAFSATLFGTFIIAGYLYDRVFVMWAPSHEVAQERNPFQYMPRPIDRILWLPIYATLLDVSERLTDEYDLDKAAIMETREYYSKLEKFRPEVKEDIDRAIKLRTDYVAAHPFSDLLNNDSAREDVFQDNQGSEK